VDASKPGDKNVEEGRMANPSVSEQQPEHATQPRGMNFRHAFRILGLDTDASPDGINESYVTSCALCLRRSDGAHDKSRLAERLYEINRAYESALDYVNSRKHFNEEAFNEVSKICGVTDNNTTANMPTALLDNLHNYKAESEVGDSKMNTQGLFVETYSKAFGHLGIFVPIIISSVFVFVTSQSVNIAMPLMAQFAKVLTGHSMPFWATAGCTYVLFCLLISAIVSPLTAVVFDGIINKTAYSRNYISLLGDRMSVRLFKCYSFVFSILFILLMSFVMPSILLMHYYVESIEATLIILCLDILMVSLVTILVIKRVLIFPYIAINSDQSIFASFRYIHQLTIKNVLLIWLVNLPLCGVAIILRTIKKYIDSKVFLVILDYLFTLNFVVIVCLSMTLVSLFYVKKRDSRETLVLRKA
jgi:hypothetical protein